MNLCEYSSKRQGNDQRQEDLVDHRGFPESVIPADAIARAIAFAIEQPADVDVNEIIVRPIGQSG